MPVASYDPITGNVLGTQRSLLSIYNDLNALTLAQKNAIWANFTAGSPPLWSTDDGPYAGTVMACSVAAIDMTNLTTAVQTIARLKMVAAYVLDRPLYLVNPTFDPSVLNLSIPGYQ